MNRTGLIAIIAVGSIIGLTGCGQEKKNKDRTQASEMYGRICRLTKDYIDQLASAEDSLSWASACFEFEDKLDKISFSYPPDTDLLLTEGQNDTIHSLMQEYVRTRDKRIDEILHPVLEQDSVSDVDALSDKIQEAH
ncbi:MAG: hypothetical protein K2N09_04980 [Muribaculaceae bacterium]|nr:hypothetical protein [Muribaculaceae bacterium]